jgi:hypothetical protein
MSGTHLLEDIKKPRSLNCLYLALFKVWLICGLVCFVVSSSAHAVSGPPGDWNPEWNDAYGWPQAYDPNRSPIWSKSPQHYEAVMWNKAKNFFPDVPLEQFRPLTPAKLRLIAVLQNAHDNAKYAKSYWMIDGNKPGKHVNPCAFEKPSLLQKASQYNPSWYQLANGERSLDLLHNRTLNLLSKPGIVAESGGAIHIYHWLDESPGVVYSPRGAVETKWHRLELSGNLLTPEIHGHPRPFVEDSWARDYLETIKDPTNPRWVVYDESVFDPKLTGNISDNLEVLRKNCAPPGKGSLPPVVPPSGSYKGSNWKTLQKIFQHL